MSLITIQCVGGTISVRARLYGPLAVHRTLVSLGGDFMDSQVYTISHVATGMAVNTAMESKKAAMFHASRLAKLPIWDFDTSKRSKQIRQRFHQEWKKIAEEWSKRETI